jgi:gamma-glutamyl phosphate reductase
MTTPYDIIQWIEKHTTLHTDVMITYVVDGYDVEVLRDSTYALAGPFNASTVFDALELAMREYP